MPALPRPFRHPIQPLQRQQGAALLVALFVAIILGLAFLFRTPETGLGDYAREQSTASVLAQAKDALIGKAVSERNNDLYGLLQIPDLGSTRNTTPGEGVSVGGFTGNVKNLSVIGRLPWRTLGLAPLKDANGECLWYALSGSAKSASPPDVFNWDSIGHFDIFKSDGTAAGTVSTTAGNYHDRPWAILFAAGPPLAGQDRSASASDTVTECGGNYDVRNYLDTDTANANLQNIVNYFSGTTNHATGDASALATPKAFIAGNIDVTSAGNKTRIVNDRLLTITAKDIFDRIKTRSDFKSDIDTLLNSLTTCLNAEPPETLPAASTSNKGIDNIISFCSSKLTSNQTKILNNWKDNLLYAGGPSGNFSVSNSTATCKAILLFGGERTTRTVAPLTAQIRATPAQKGDNATYGDPAMYLEGTNATQFPANGAYKGSAFYATAAPSADVVRCITGLDPGVTQVSFTNDLPNFVKTGATSTMATDTTNNSLTITDNATGAGAGCFWYPTPIPLANKTLRVYYEYQFGYADTFATSGSLADRGNGLTFQLVRGNVQNTEGTVLPPNTCGRENQLGALGTSDRWGSFSYIVETDIRRNAANDPAGNHTAILLNGSLAHAANETQTATATTPCNGTKSSCLFYPANTFEESPVPLLHNQRLELHTGCNSSCSRCIPGSGDSYAKISVWVDCTDCRDITTDFVSPELITNNANRDFNAAGDWTGSHWSWSANALTHTAGPNAATLPNSSLASPLVIGATYRVKLVMNTSTPGTLAIALGGNSTVFLPPASGEATYDLLLTLTSTAPLTVTPDATWEGSLTSASVHAIAVPQINRCVPLYNPELQQAFFGINAGFLSATNTVQSVTIKNLFLRSE